MSFRSDLQTATAQLAYDIIGVTGSSSEVTATYSNRGASGVSITVHPEAESQELADMIGLQSNETARRFLVPKQTNFPPTAGIAVNDEMTYPTNATYKYRIVKWEDISGGVGSLFQLSCARSLARRVGAV